MNFKIQKCWLVECLILLACIFTIDSQACKYTVRDVAFAELDPLRYRLFVITDSGASDEIRARLEKAAMIALDESNVLPEMVNLSKEPDHFAKKYVSEFNIEKLPVAILAYGKGSSLPIKIEATALNAEKNLTELFSNIIASPFRDQLMQKSINTYGTVVVIEGTDAQENVSVLRMADSAVKRMINDMPHLPKTIKGEPSVTVFKRAQFAQEKIFLWHIEAYAAKEKQPAIMISYGRGRQIGKLLKGNEITADRIYKMLSIIGADCECGLPRFWMQGKVYPYRYTEEIRENMARSIGFDPENPLVKIEMKQMVGKGDGSGSKNPANKYIKFDDIDNVAGIGYTEIELDFGDSEEDLTQAGTTEQQAEQIASVPQKNDRPEIKNQRNKTGSSDQQVAPTQNNPTSAGQPGSTRTLIVVIGALSALMILGGFAVIISARFKA